jgi:peptidyl-dipeptidase Dcp
MTSRLTLSLAIASALALSACSGPTAPNAETETQAATEQATVENPFFQPSSLPYQLPPFDQITDAHYAPAFERGMVEHSAEVAAIADNPEPASFENTIVAMERSGQLLSRVSRVFFNLAGAHTNDAIQAVQAEMAPKLSAHQDAIALNPALFERVEALYQNRDSLGLDPEQKRLLERYRTDFVRAGAQLDDAQKTRLKEINSELATLQTQFSQNVLKEVNASAIVVDSRDELAGLSENQIAAAAKAAAERGMEGKFVVALMNTSGQPPLGALENRPLRERIMRASLTRGSQGGEFDNRGILTRVATLRAERALMLGYPTHAAYVLEDQTAGTTEAVNGMLARLAPAAVGNAKREAADLQAMIDAEGGDFELAPWDWDFYAEKVRQERYAFDESQLKPYFEMMNVLENGVFHAANQLYGLRFERRTDLPTYHPDVVVYEVFDADGEPLALFLGDFYARPSKRGGAWMNAYVPQSGMFDTKPVVANHQNIPKPPEGQPTLMTFDEVTTMFHEFGHALHGMFSDVHYPRFSGTSVPRDFVEYPSQVNEMWATWPEILANYAKHHETGEPMPQELLDKVQAAEQFNQGFSTTEYLAASLLDQAWHQLSPEQIPDAEGLLDFEAAALAKAGVDFAPVPPRYRSTYFSHIIGGYSAGYYSYIWSEVLDADSVEWFKENGGLKRENGDHFRNTLLSQGGSKDAMELFRDFRGRDADITPLLERRGLNRAAGD